MLIVASPETVARIRDGGGLLFVWLSSSRGPRLVLTILVASLDPPPDTLGYRRFDHDLFTLFVHPSIHSLPDELWVEFRGHRVPHVCVYWNGLAFVAWVRRTPKTSTARVHRGACLQLILERAGLYQTLVFGER